MCKEGIRVGRATTVTGVVVATGAGTTVAPVAGPDAGRIAITMAMAGLNSTAGDVAILEADLGNTWVPVIGISNGEPFGSANVEWWGQLVLAGLRITARTTANPVITVGLIRVPSSLGSI